MRPGDLVAISVETLPKNQPRTFLTVLGITIGITALTAALSIMEGTNQTVNKTLAGFGGKFMAVYPDWDPALSRPKARNFDLADARAIRGVSGVNLISLNKRSYRIPVSYLNRSMQTDIVGTDLNYLLIRNRKIKTGRFISVQDIFNERRVCVITEGIKKRFFPAGDYLERQLEINGQIFTIIGCLKPMLSPAAFGGNTEEETIFIPITTAQRLFRSYDYDLILLRYANEYEPKREIKLLKGRIAAILKFRKGPANEYVLKTLDELAAPQKKTAVTVTVALGGVAFLCLLLGGIGIRNIMMVTVLERLREIGIRKAIGACNAEIFSQFLCAAVLISAAGGLAGLFLGVISARMVVICAGMPVRITWWSLLLGAGFMLSAGIVSALYPARKAAAVRPVEGLRCD